jgi:hypothetical protein
MSSFTDAIPQFNPYIQQLPVEALVSVGMEKQRRYDEGVQRIQSQIDQVAGLDIARDVDRQYLQSKLNELGTKLRTVAAGDFSNYQLVNSTAGMAASVAKDKNVMGAVQSTAKYRKELAFMEEARQKGESAIQNEYDFMEQTNKWMNDTNIGASYNGRYRKYIDVDKKWLDVIKSLHPDLIEQDIPYETNPDGSINYGKTAAAMQRISKEGVDSNKIQNALRASLSPDELEQLNINGKYQFRGIQDPEQLATLATSTTNSIISQNAKIIEELKGAQKLYASDPQKYADVEEGIKALEAQNRQLMDEVSYEVELAATNPDALKGLIYKKGAIEQFASAHAWEKQKYNLLTNPIREDEWKAKNYDIALRRQNLAERESSFNMQMKLQDYDLKVKEMEMKFFGSAGEPFSVIGGTDTDVPDQQTVVMKDIQDKSIMVEDQVNFLLKELNAGGGAKVEKVQLLNVLDKYLKGDVAEYESLIPKDLQSLADSIISTKSDLSRKEQYWKNVQRQALEQSAAKIDPVTIKTSSGEITFTPQEVANYLSKVKSTTGVVAEPQAGIRLQPDTAVTSNLTQKERILHENRGSKLSQIEDVYESTLDELLLQAGGQFATRQVDIVFGSGDGNIARSTWDNIATSLLSKVVDNDLSGMRGGYPGLSADDAEEVLNWYASSDKNNIQYKKLERGDTTSLVIMKGSERFTIPLTPEEAAKLPLRDSGAITSQERRLVEAQQMGNRNTNPSGKFEDAYFKKPSMPRVNLNVRADMKHDVSNPGANYITLRLKLPDGTVYPYDLPTPVGRMPGINFIGNLTDEKIKQLYLDSPNVPAKLKAYLQTP